MVAPRQSFGAIGGALYEKVLWHWLPQENQGFLKHNSDYVFDEGIALHPKIKLTKQNFV